MKPLDVIGKNFCGYEELNIQLHKQGLIGITGVNKDTASATSNGSGKSNFFKAISWCWFGKYIDDKIGNQVIKNGQKHSILESRIEMDDGIWTIKRERRKDQPKLALIQPSGAEWQGEKNDIQTKIDRMLGMDYHTFRNVVLYAEGDTKRFASVLSKDSDRKDILHVIMRTDIFKKCRQVVKDKAKELKDSLLSVAVNIDSLENKMSSNKEAIKRLKEKKDTYAQSQKDRTKVVAEDCKTMLDELRELESKRSNIPALIEKIDKLKLTVIDVTSIRADMEAAIINRSKIREKLGVCNSGIGSTNASLRLKKESLSELEQDNCPTCTAPLDSGAPKDYKDSLNLEISELENGLKSQRVELSKLEKSNEDNENHIKECRASIERGLAINTKIEELEKELRSLKSTDSKAAELKATIKRKRESIDVIKNEVNPYEEQINELAKDNKTSEESLSNLKVRRSGWENELAHQEFWVRGFSDQGLPSYILDSVMPFITERTNYYLDTLSDGDIRVTFDTQRQLKSSKNATRDEISMEWEIEGLANYPPSSGQQRKITISAELALMDLVASRENGRPGILLLDEIFDGLDKEGASRVGILLQKMREDCGTIYVISHDPNVCDFFDRNLEVVREDSTSTVEEAA